MISRIIVQSILFLAAVGAVTGGISRAKAADEEKPQYYEVRIYSTKSDGQRQRISDYWQNAAVPAYNRMGIQPIGVFTEIQEAATNKVYVLIPCDSPEVFAAIPEKLAADTTYQAAAADFLGSTKANPAYERIESSLLVAFNGMKHLVVPPPEKKPNVFELRTYMSPSESKGLNKIQMFESGEITVMKELDMAPVFYGKSLIGPHMPCLMYMTCGVSMEEHTKHWDAFGKNAVWQKLSGDPYYKDNMIGMTRVLLKRMGASQI